MLRQCRASLGDRVLRLQDEPPAILKGLYRLGALVVTTFAPGARVSQSMRYPALVDDDWSLECRGEQCRLSHHLDMSQWQSVMAVLAPVADLAPRSLLFFDRFGQPLQQMAVAPESGGLAFEELVCAMLHPDQRHLGQTFSPRRATRAPGLLVSEMERLWSHGDDDSFRALLRQLDDRREVLYQAVRDKFACPARLETVPALLATASQRGEALTVCTGNAGVRLCLTAPWSAPRWQGGQCHLAHNGVLMSLDMGRVASVWRLRRPGPGRVVTALEALDVEGRWLWTLSAGDDEERWLALLSDSLIREGRPGMLMA
tara:strand:- start:44342 stop:45286 length:945 start_codon:yes stop_codon:yes gene_type:complete